MLKNSALLSIFITMLSVTCNLYAQTFNNPKFVSSNAGQNNSTQVIKQISDITATAVQGQGVVIKGTIQQQTSSEIYVFQDQTGQINVEIENDAWKYIPTQLNNQTPVYVVGEVDRRKDGSLIIEAVAILPEKF